MTNTIVPIGKVHIGDLGTKFKLTVLDQTDPNTQQPVNLPDVTTPYMIFLKADGVTQNTFTATVFNPPGTDGVIEYTNNDVNFINQTGLWKRLAKLLYTDGSVFYS